MTYRQMKDMRDASQAKFDAKELDHCMGLMGAREDGLPAYIAVPSFASIARSAKTTARSKSLRLRAMGRR